MGVGGAPVTLASAAGAAVGTASAPLVTSSGAADGALTAVPAGSTNGTLLSGRPTGAQGVFFYTASGDAVTYAVATTAPVSAPAVTLTITGPIEPPRGEMLGKNTNIYVTATTGTPKYRWV